MEGWEREWASVGRALGERERVILGECERAGGTRAFTGQLECRLNNVSVDVFFQCLEARMYFLRIPFRSLNRKSILKSTPSFFKSGIVCLFFPPIFPMELVLVGIASRNMDDEGNGGNGKHHGDDKLRFVMHFA